MALSMLPNDLPQELCLCGLMHPGFYPSDQGIVLQEAALNVFSVSRTTPADATLETISLQNPAVLN